MQRLFVFSAVAIAVAAAAVATTYSTGVPYRGVSVAGLEFKGGADPWWGRDANGVPVLSNKWGSLPYLGSTQYFINKGANLIRIPFRWDRLQVPDYNGYPSQDGSGNPVFDEQYWGFIKAHVTNATSQGAVAVLDMHNYARYPYIDNAAYDACLGKNFIGKDSKASLLHYKKVWAKIAATYNQNDKVWFGLMNEPAADTTPGVRTNNGGTPLNPAEADWSTFLPQDAWNLQKAAVEGIRDSAGNTNYILLAGSAWTGAHTWDNDWYAVSTTNGLQGSALNNKKQFTQVEPHKLNYAKLVIEVHSYFDNNHGGKTTQCLAYDTATILDGLSTWATENSYSLFMGEWAFYAPNTNCANQATALLTYLNTKSTKNGGPWLAWAYWAAGHSWGDNRVSEPSQSNIVTADLAGSASAEPDWTWNQSPKPANPCIPDGAVNQCYHTDKPVVVWFNANGDATGKWWVPAAQGSGSNPPPQNPPPSGGNCATNGYAADNQMCYNGNTAQSASNPSTTNKCCSNSASSCTWVNDYWWECRTGSAAPPPPPPPPSGSGSCSTNGYAADNQVCYNGNTAQSASNPSSTNKCCSNSGSSCTWVNDYWWECRVGTGSNGGSNGGNNGGNNGGSSGTCVAQWSQCGGTNPGTNSAWTGATTCCAGKTCVVVNSSYHQCQ